jgi:drug/metabolite transporter (DMT)-like permease
MDRPALLLVLTTLFWGGNAVAGRLAVDQVSPAQLTLLRWVVAGGIILPMTARAVARSWPLLRRQLPYLAAMGALGFTSYNLLYYSAAHVTSAINIAIVTASTPVLMLAGGRLVLRARIRPLQWAGAAVAFGGIVAVASGGSWTNLARLAFNHGDLMVLAASALYAGYSLALRRRPQVGPLVFFASIVPAAVVTALVPVVVELSAGTARWPTPMGLAVVLYVGLFPSLLAQVFFVRAVELIGPARAGLYTNLTPVFGAGLAWLMLGEQPGAHHALGLVLVLAGIALSELSARPA